MNKLCIQKIFYFTLSKTYSYCNYTGLNIYKPSDSQRRGFYYNPVSLGRFTDVELAHHIATDPEETSVCIC